MSDDEYFSQNSDDESIISTGEKEIVTINKKIPEYEGNENDDEKEEEEEKENDVTNNIGDDEEEDDEDEDEDEDENEVDVDDNEDEEEEEVDDELEGGGGDDENNSVENDVKKIKSKQTKKVKPEEYASLDIFSNKGVDLTDEINDIKSYGTDSETDNDEGDDDEYLQTLEKNVKSNYFEETHPESLMHNYLEIAAMTNIIRDKYGNIQDPLHRTIPILTKYEKTRILGQRTKQIESGSLPFIKVPTNVIDSYLIAEMELEEKKIPFIVKRPLPAGGSEYWKLKDLELISF